MTVPAGYGQPSEPSEPAAPQGPGVVPPFAAPPTERDNKRLWIGLTIGAVMLVLCCVGGVAGFGVMIAGGMKQIEAQSRDTVSDYLKALKGERYSTAYKMLCERLKDDESLYNFARHSRSDRVVDYTVGDAEIRENEITVAATVRYEHEDQRREEYLVQSEAGAMTVCGKR